MDRASMLGSPAADYTTDSALRCARDCLAEGALCQSFALFRNVDPAAGEGVNCRRYVLLSPIVYDESSVTYYTGNKTLPLP